MLLGISLALWYLLSGSLWKLPFIFLLDGTFIAILVKWFPKHFGSQLWQLPQSVNPASSSRRARLVVLIILLGWCLFAVSYLHPPRPPIESCDLPTKCVDEESTAIVPASVVRANGLQRLNAMGFQFQKQRLAIVMPFIASQIDRLTSNMKLWEPYRACQLTENGERVINTVETDLVFYFDKDLETAPALEDGRRIEEYFTQFWQNFAPAITKCFRKIDFLSAKLTDAQNRHPDGPCVQHFKLHHLLRGKYDHFFQMEPDVLPIQDDWLDGLAYEVTLNGPNCDHWWMKGSMSRCDGRYGLIAKRRDFHINGNAMYCLGDPRFLDFFRRVQAFYPAGAATGSRVAGCSTGRWAEGGWDHTFFQFRQDPANFDYAKHINHKFQLSPFIVNMCEDEYDREALLRQEPATLLVHSKFPFLSPADQALRRLFLRILGRYSEARDREQLMGLTEEEQLRVLCNSDERRNYERELADQGKLTPEIRADCAPYQAL